jgi:hypothetical protein
MNSADAAKLSFLKHRIFIASGFSQCKRENYASDGAKRGDSMDV